MGHTWLLWVENQAWVPAIGLRGAQLPPSDDDSAALEVTLIHGGRSPDPL